MSYFEKCAGRPAQSALVHRTETGQALVEFALLLPLLSLILMGTVDLGQLCYAGIETASAARAAAEYGAQSPITAANNSGMLQAAQQDAPDLTNLSVTSSSYVCQCSTAPGTNITCSTAPTSCTARVLVFVQVTTSAQYTPIFSYPGQPSSTVTGQATMPVSP